MPRTAVRDDRRWYARACQNSSKCWAPNTKKCQVAKLPGAIIFGCSRLVSHNHFSHRGNTWCVCVTSICVTMKKIEHIHRLAHALAIHRGKLMKTDDRSVLNLNTSTPAWSRWHFFWHKKNRGIAFYQNADRLPRPGESHGSNARRQLNAWSKKRRINGMLFVRNG